MNDTELIQAIHETVENAVEKAVPAAVDAAVKEGFEGVCQKIDEMDQRLTQRMDEMDQRLTQRLDNQKMLLTWLKNDQQFMSKEIGDLRDELKYLRYQNDGEHDKLYELRGQMM